MAAYREDVAEYEEITRDTAPAIIANIKSSYNHINRSYEGFLMILAQMGQKSFIDDNAH